MKSSEKWNGIHKSMALMLAVGQFSVLSILPSVAADNKVRIAGNPVITLVGTTGSDRADKIQHNIDNSLVAASSHGPSSVKITYVKGLPVISLGGYYITTVDNVTAKANGTTASLLAQKWANALKSALANSSSTEAYIAQLSGKSTVDSSYTSPSTPSYDTTASNSLPSNPVSDPSSSSGDSSSPSTIADAAPQTAPQYGWQSMAKDPSTNQAPSYQPAAQTEAPAPTPAYPSTPYQGRLSYVPAGMSIPVKLATSLSSQVAKPGDLIMAKTTQDIALANGNIPANSTLIGQVVDSNGGAWMGRSGKLAIKFTSLRTPNGLETPISAHISGNIGKYADRGNDTFRGENTMSKVKKTLVASAIGAGGGSALGLAVGAIAGGGRGVGRGAWSGAAIGAGVGLAESLLIRRGSDVNLTQGQDVNLQLDAPVSIAMN